MTNYTLIYSTAPSRDEAMSLGQSLLEYRLAACVNIIPGMESLYWWEGDIENGQEIVIIAKTTEALAKKAIEHIRSHHSHSIPCIVAVPIVDGAPEFLSWISKETEKV